MSRSRKPSVVPRSASVAIARRWWWLAALLAAGGVGWWVSRHAPFEAAVPVPAIDLSHASRELSAAVAAARVKVEQEPRSAAAWGELGMWLMAHQFEHEANVCLEQAGRWDSQDPRWPYLLGLSLSVSQRDRAIDEFRRALTLRDRWAVAHTRLGELLLAREDFDDAERELRKAYEQDANDPRVYDNLSRLSLMRGDAATALTWARQAVRLAPDVQSLHELLAAIHQRLGNRDAASLELRISEQAPMQGLEWHDELAAKVLALRNDTGQQLELAQTLLHAQRPDEAIRVLYAALREDERDLRLTVLLAQTLNQRQRRTDLESLLNAAEQTHPESAELRFQRGVSQFQAEQFAAA
ncbi:MAG: tetratricopeptide repeat protein, partial [Planctomycetaceae bacterium]|nr:tetratricopeptide repeat protein [Planctomycetaceae bacterium]